MKGTRWSSWWQQVPACGLIMGTVCWTRESLSCLEVKGQGNICLKVFWKLFLLLQPMETSGERAVVREESEQEGSAVLSWLPATPCAAGGVDAESKACQISVQTRGWQGHICCLKNWPGGTGRDENSWMCEHVSYRLVNRFLEPSQLQHKLLRGTSVKRKPSNEKTFGNSIIKWSFLNLCWNQVILFA